jgi:hypothetical protein
MNCATIQRGLLGLARLDEPPVAVRRHLAECPVCRAYQEQLVELERRIPALPVPPSTAKAALLRQILAEPEKPVERPRLIPARQGWQIRERARQKLALATALAATLVVFAVGLAVWKYTNEQEKDPLVRRIEGYAPRAATQLAQARTPRERVVALAQAAETLFEHGQKMRSAGANQDLETLSFLYKDVVDQLHKEDAPALAITERAVVLNPIRQQLAQTQKAAEQLASELPANSASLRRIAAAAAEGELQLQKLIGEAV